MLFLTPSSGIPIKTSKILAREVRREIPLFPTAVKNKRLPTSKATTFPQDNLIKLLSTNVNFNSGNDVTTITHTNSKNKSFNWGQLANFNKKFMPVSFLLCRYLQTKVPTKDDTLINFYLILNTTLLMMKSMTNSTLTISAPKVGTERNKKNWRGLRIWRLIMLVSRNR